MKIQALIPRPDFAGNINNWIQASKHNKITATPAIKIDHSITSTRNYLLPEQKLESHDGERQDASRFR